MHLEMNANCATNGVHFWNPVCVCLKQISFVFCSCVCWQQQELQSTAVSTLNTLTALEQYCILGHKGILDGAHQLLLLLLKRQQ